MDTPELYHETAQSQEPFAEPRQYGDPMEPGDLLALAMSENPADQEKAAAQLIERFDSQWKIVDAEANQWLVNVLRHKGVPGVRVKSGDSGEPYVPTGASPDSVPSMNKLADDLRRLGALLFSDPPASEAIPPSDSDEDKDAAEFSSQVLEEIDGESGLDDVAVASRAWARGSDYGSGFVFYYTDPRGGGRVPLQIQAGFDPASGRRAAHESEAAFDPLFPPEYRVGWPEYERRYVRGDGSLTGERSEAAMQWSPKLRSKIFVSRQVRFLPHTCRDIWDAEGLLLVDFPTWDEAKHDHPELAELSDEEATALVQQKPRKHEKLTTKRERDAGSATLLADKPVWRLRCFYRSCPAYPDGAHLVLIGGKRFVVAEPWTWTNAKGEVEEMDIPVTQYAHLSEGRDSPYHVGMSEVIGGANELRTYIWGFVLSQLERIRNQKRYVPTIGKMHLKHLRSGARDVPIAPGTEPRYEQIPDLPNLIPQAFEIISRDMDHSTGLQEGARGLMDSSVTSGRQAYAIIAQIRQGLSDLIRNIERGWTRAGRIKLQLIRKDYTTEQHLLWSGDDDEWKQKAWMNADLGSTRDVRLKVGSLSMMSPAQKEAMAFEWHQLGIISKGRLDEIVAGNLGATIGMQQDPHRSRIKRQMNRWKEGPPEGWQPPAPMMQPRMVPQSEVDPYTGEAVPLADPMTGAPIMGPGFDEFGQPLEDPVLDPMGRPTYQPDPLLAAIFQPIPADTMPTVAALRLEIISDVMASKRYLSHPVEWRAALDAEFFRMAGAAAPAPPAQASGAPEGAPPPEGFSEKLMQPAA